MPLAALGFIGGLYHVLNHAAFKGLLFLGAGSVLHATHTRNMEEMGGLIKRMPWTALFFLIGAAAISALPPLNGFASEWLVFQSLLGGVNIPVPEVAVVMPVAVGLLALSGGLLRQGVRHHFPCPPPLVRSGTRPRISILDAVRNGLARPGVHWAWRRAIRRSSRSGRNIGRTRRPA
jgi:formate hydrogenlyase subunit 3/multisubunit Na+/H+ antiporter MnhD subunit